MRKFSLRLPYLIYLSIGSMLLGVLVAPAFRDMPPMELMEQSLAAAPAPMAPDHMHGMIDVPRNDAPQVGLAVARDPVGGWNITLDLVNFTFTPEAVNDANTPNTGHAHLYVDGQKVARLYGPHFHLPDLAPGPHEIRVTLSTNDHSYYMVEGVRAEARAVVMQGDGPMGGS